MIVIDVKCSLENFWINSAGHGVYGDEICLEGWCLSNPPIEKLELVFGGETPMSFEVHNRARDSAGIFELMGRDYGEPARHCRFLLVEKMPSTLPDFGKASVRISLRDGRALSLPLGEPKGLAGLRRELDADSALVMRFESCGDNCEFGLLQRKIGIERMGLMRYSGAADVFALAATIERRFEGFAEGMDLQIHPFGAEWMASVHGSRMNFHTGRTLGDFSEQRIHQEEGLKLRFLAQKFLDDLEEGKKIFVYRTLRDDRGGPDGMKGMDRLYDAMRGVGPAKLLWVNEADENSVPGEVRHIRDGLYHGFIERLAPHSNAFDSDPAAWLRLLRRAAEMVDEAEAAAAGEKVLTTA